MSSSDCDADPLKSSGAGMMRKTGLRYHDFFLKSCAPVPISRILPESSRTAGMSRPAPVYVTENTPVCCRSQRTGDVWVNGSWPAVHPGPRKPEPRLFTKRG